MLLLYAAGLYNEMFMVFYITLAYSVIIEDMFMDEILDIYNSP